MGVYIDRKQALSHPFANGKYDHEHANEHFILGFESYKEWLEDLPTIDLVRCGECKHWDKAVNGHLIIEDHLCRRALRWTLNIDYCSDGERRADEHNFERD